MMEASNIQRINLVLFCVFFFLYKPLLSQEPEVMWAKHLGNEADVSITRMVDDNNHDYILSGYYLSDVNFGNGVILNYVPFGSNFFLSKLDSTGTMLWAKKVPIRRSLLHNQLLVDDDNAIYLTGHYGAGYLQGGGGLQIDGTLLPQPMSNEGGYCLAKFKSDGILEWARTIDLNGASLIYEPSLSIHKNPDGTIRLIAQYKTDAIFDDGFTITNNAANISFLAANFNSEGNRLSIIDLGSENPAHNPSTDHELFDVDRNGHIYRYVTANQTLKKYNSEGLEIEGKVISISPQSMARICITSMEVDFWGNILLAGGFSGSELIVENTVLASYGSVNNNDAFIIKLQANNFNLVWSYQYEYPGCDRYTKIQCDDLGNAYVIGMYNNCLSEDKLLYQKISADGNLLSEKIIQGVIQNINHPVPMVYGTEIKPSFQGGNSIVAGVFRGNVQLDAETSFSTSLPDKYSVFIAELGNCRTEKPPIQNEQVWLCPDESVEISADFNNSDYWYTWNNGEITETISIRSPGCYYVIARENDECYMQSDKIKVKNSEPLNRTITQDNSILISDEQHAFYQWVDCNTYLPVPGAVNRFFLPSEPGVYQVIITGLSGCSDTSECYSIQFLGLKSEQVMLLVFPNPVSDKLHVETDLNIGMIRVVNNLGQELMYVYNQKKVNMKELPPGMYVLEVSTEKETVRIPVVKQ